MKILSAGLLFTAVTLTFAMAEQPTAVAGWCRVYVSPDRSHLRFFFEDGRYGWMAADVKKRKDGTYSASEHEDYSDRTGTWKMNGGEIESHEYWVRTGVHLTPNPPPMNEHYSFKDAISLEASRVLHLRDPITMFHAARPSENLMFIELDKAKDFQHGLIADTCNHAKESPRDVAQEWLKFCTQ
jgi:hypothetical protein